MSQEGYPGGEMESELERASYYQEGNWFGWTIFLTFGEKTSTFTYLWIFLGMLGYLRKHVFRLTKKNVLHNAYCI